MSENKNIFTHINEVYSNVNVLMSLQDEGFFDVEAFEKEEAFKLKKEVTVKSLNEFLEEEHGFDAKFFASKKDFKKWLIKVAEELKMLSGLLKFYAK